MPEPTYRIAQRLHERRAAVGLPKYGRHLDAESQGCMLVHALEESADKTNYLIAEVQRRRTAIKLMLEVAEVLTDRGMHRDAVRVVTMIDLLGGEAALERYDEILEGAEDTTVAALPKDADAEAALAAVSRDEAEAARAKMQEGEGDCRFCRDLEGDSNYPCTCGWTYGALATAYGNTLQERDALAAHVERLEKALRAISERLTETSWRRDCDHIRCTCEQIGCNGAKFRAIEELLEAALASTPTQSLAAHDALVKVAVLREAIDTFPNIEGGALHERSFAVWVLHMADRIEKEVPHA